MYLLHDVINEQIFLELLLKDQDLMLGLNTVIAIHPPYFEVLREDTGVKVHHHRVILVYCLDLALKSSEILFHLQHLEVLLLELLFFLLFFDEVKQGDG